MILKDARKYAQTLGGELAMIKSQDMQNYIYNNIISQSTTDMWIGLNDKAKEGTRHYNDEILATYTNWNSNEPNNKGDEDYAEFYKNNSGCWNDLNGTAKYLFLIQIGTP